MFVVSFLLFSQISTLHPVEPTARSSIQLLHHYQLALLLSMHRSIAAAADSDSQKEQSSSSPLVASFPLLLNQFKLHSHAVADAFGSLFNAVTAKFPAISSDSASRQALHTILQRSALSALLQQLLCAVQGWIASSNSKTMLSLSILPLFHPLYVQFFKSFDKLISSSSESPNAICPTITRPLLCRKGLSSFDAASIGSNEETKQSLSPEEKKAGEESKLVEWNYDILQAILSRVSCPAAIMEIVGIWKVADINRDGVIERDSMGVGPVGDAKWNDLRFRFDMPSMLNLT